MRTVDAAEADDSCRRCICASPVTPTVIHPESPGVHVRHCDLLRSLASQCAVCTELGELRDVAWCEGCDPAELLDWQDRLKRVNVALAALPPKPRRAFVLSRKQSCSYAEIARQLDVSVSMIEKHISMALGQLRMAL
jgi:RNA polymerase sigma factor (sigma-70 family)